MKYGYKWTLVYLCVFVSHNLPAKPILQAEIDGKMVGDQENVSLFSGYHEIIFYFPSDKKKQTKYSFKISELEQKWVETSYPFARYTNLNGGEFHFYLKYLDTNNQEITLRRTFEIKENFWEKWWFYLFVILFSIAGVSLLIYFWFLYDLRQKMRTHAIRQKIAADLHDEVGANLSSISFLVESLKKSLNGQKGNFDPILDRISGNSLETAGLINDTIWALNPDYDNFEKLLERIKSFGSTILSAKDIAFSIENELDSQHLELNIDERRNLFFSLKEAINNAAKHSGASKVLLKISEINSKIHISVLDNGIGFDTEEFRNGNGLKNFKIREHLAIVLKSEIGTGTTVEIILNPKNH
jgi:hypothetical protein